MKKHNKTKQKQSSRYREQIGGCQREGQQGGGKKKGRELKKHKLSIAK